MEDNSWLRRTKFSHTVYTRVGSRGHGVPIAPLSREVEQKLQRFVSMGKSVSMFIDRDSENEVAALKHTASLPSVRSSLLVDKEKANKQKVSLKIPSSPPLTTEKNSKGRARNLLKSPSKLQLLSMLNKETPNQDGPQLKARSKSPLPSVVPSDVFREARATSQRFTSPPPMRVGSENNIYGKSFGREVSDAGRSPYWCSEKQRSHKGSSWTRRYFDNGGKRRVSAVDPSGDCRARRVSNSMAHEVQTKADWTLERSKLLVGDKFASGAYSRLFKGLYYDKPVAVKFIRVPDDDENGKMAAKLEKQYNTEVNALSHLYHKNVIKLEAVLKFERVFLIITEFLPGGSLRSYLHSTQHHPIPLEKIISITLDVARGMEYIHSQGVVHRDIKPENILFDENFNVKIADFGIACEEASCEVLKDEGTYRWMAPEMFKPKPYNRKVDVYSFGLLLWEMVSGRIPYENLNPCQVAFAVTNGKLKPTLPLDCPMALRSLIEQCCALQPEKRPDFWQIVRVLEQFHSVLSQGGSLDALKSSSTCQDPKKRLQHWIQKLKPSHST